jgi:hypothetical protein
MKVYYHPSRLTGVTIATWYRMDDPGSIPGIASFSLLDSFRPEPTHLPVQCVWGSVSPGIKRSGCGADHSPPSSAEFKNDGAILHTSACLHVLMLN